MQWQDLDLEDEDADQGHRFYEDVTAETPTEMLAEALEFLNDREKDILTQRRLRQDGHAGRPEWPSMTSAASVSARSRLRALKSLQKRFMRDLARKGLHGTA